MEFFTIIAGRKLKDSLIESLSEEGGRLITVMYGKGSVKSDYLRDMFGLVPEENKVVITCLLPLQKTDAVSDMLVKKFHFDKPNTGIAFTIPINLSL
ncbi:MAG: hypothetical protein GX235_12460 [Clostridiales bacterium]|nr:hypothetical protein [Clostridiales bacterium]